MDIVDACIIFMLSKSVREVVKRYEFQFVYDCFGVFSVYQYFCSFALHCEELFPFVVWQFSLEVLHCRVAHLFLFFSTH